MTPMYSIADHRLVDNEKIPNGEVLAAFWNTEQNATRDHEATISGLIPS